MIDEWQRLPMFCLPGVVKSSDVCIVTIYFYPNGEVLNGACVSDTVQVLTANAPIIYLYLSIEGYSGQLTVVLFAGLFCLYFVVPRRRRRRRRRRRNPRHPDSLAVYEL
jgi:hypothetical protein